MDSSRINGSVKKVGTRVTRTERNVRVEDILEISLETTADQQKALESNPAELIKRFLTQEGLAFKDVVVRGDLRSMPVSHLRSEWFHVVYDAAEPNLVCKWLYVPDAA